MAPDASTRYSLFCCILAFLLLSTPTLSRADTPLTKESLIGETVELPFTYLFKKQLMTSGNELQVAGTNTTDSALILIIRIDNNASENYRSRFNREFSIQPGPFTINIPITGLKTSGKQPLVQPYTQMIIFIAGEAKGVMLESAEIKQPPPPPKEVLALDFGLRDSPVFPGFQRVNPTDSMFEGSLRPRYRPSGDSLIRDGFEGIKKVSLPWKNGYWKLSLWTQEQGEWEYLPHPLSKKIIAENEVMVDQVLTEDHWIEDIYLAGKKQEAVIDGDLWNLVGQRRSGLIQKVVHITDEQLDIFLEGNQSARYLAGLVLEPADHHFSDDIEKERQRRFLSLWPVEKLTYKTPDQLSLRDISEQPKSDDLQSYLAAPGSLLNLKFQIQSPENDPAPVIAIAPPRSEQGDKLELIKRYGHWRYERPTPNATSLVLSDSLLRGDFETLRLSPELPRNLYLQVAIPKEAKPGLYSSSIQLFSKSALEVINYQIKVVAAELPEMKQSVGLYLEPAPFYQWFAPLRQRKPLATDCDLSLLRNHGFTNVAPALDSPSSDSLRQSFIEQIIQLQRFGFNRPVMAYAPLKRLLIAQPVDAFEEALIKLKQQLNQRQLPDVYWSIYDEPTPEKFASIQNLARRLHGQTLDMKTAGHLNNPAQADLLPPTDLAIINHGFGVDQTQITELKNSKKVWFYNMPEPRLAAGYYLWKSGAEGYLQWHGRMPTADPFDPTDGREGDVIYLYPWSKSCPAVMDIHSRLLDLHEATLDLRWLQWLDRQAETNPAAQSLQRYLAQQIDGDWKKAENSFPRTQLIQMRQAIIDFSLSLPAPNKER